MALIFPEIRSFGLKNLLEYNLKYTWKQIKQKTKN